MKRSAIFYSMRAIAAGALLLQAVLANAQFTPGNLVVLQVGAGTTTLTGAAAPVFLKEYNKTSASQTTPVSTIAIPAFDTLRLTNVGNATTEGQMTLSSDSTRLVIVGYDADSGTAALAATTAAAVARVVDTLSFRGIPGRADTTHSAFSGGNIRAATRNNGENYWAAGNNTGIYYLGNGASPATLYAASTNLRAIYAANGKLYFSTASGLSRIGRINAQPTSGTVTADTMITLGIGNAPSPNGFAINSSETVAYVADDRSTSVGGGIQKWTLSGSIWSLTYTLYTGGALGARSVVVDWSGTYPTIYAITANSGGSLVKLIDSNATAVFFTLANGTTTGAFRSVAFTPIDPCTGFTPTATLTGPAVRCQGDTALLTANAGTGYSYQWSRNGSTLANDTLQTLKVTKGGSYTVTISRFGGKCIATSAAVAITVNPTPSAMITAGGPLTFCPGGSVQLCALNVTGNTYQWKRGVTNIPLANANCYTANVSGNYKVVVTTTTTGCSDSSTLKTVTVGPPPSAAITPAGLVFFCAGTSIKLHTNSSPGLTYSWKRNDTTLTGAGTADSTLLASIPGIYKVTVAVSANCADSAKDTLAIVALPNTSITKLSNDTVCGGDTVFVRGASGAGNMYMWEIVGVGTSPAQADSNFFQTTPDVSVTTTYNYRLIVTNSTGCIDSSALQSQTIIPVPTPFIVNNAGTLTAGVFAAYQWFRNGTAIPGANSMTHTPAANGSYTVTVSNGYCSRSSDPFIVTGVGVNDALYGAGIIIYPNPVQDILKIDAPYPVSIVVKDLSGRVVLRGNNTTALSIKALNDGAYSVSIFKLDGTLVGTKLVTKFRN